MLRAPALCCTCIDTNSLSWSGVPSLRPYQPITSPSPVCSLWPRSLTSWLSPMPYSHQFWERCKLFLMPAKHQPDHAFLRHVPLRRIHLFTLVQILCLALLWILKSTMAAIIFPVMVRRVCAARKIGWGRATRRFRAS